MGVLLFVIGAWLSVWLYLRAKPRPKMTAAIADVVVIAPASRGISKRLMILFDGQNVERVTASSVGIWNDGTQTFHGRDVVDADPLRIDLTGAGRILQATVEGMSRPHLGATATISDENRVKVAFDYLDPSDGVRLSIVHSGNPGSLQVNGTIRGLPKGLSVNPVKGGFRWLYRAGLFLALTQIITFVTIVAESRKAWTVRGAIVIAMAVILAGGLAWLANWFESRSTRKAKGIPDVVTEDDALWQGLNRPI